MSQPVLVTYATKAGSTIGVAHAIGEVLTVRGLLVTVAPITDRDRRAPSRLGGRARLGAEHPDAWGLT